MKGYELSKAISKIWIEKKSKEELENELYQLLVLLPERDLKIIYEFEIKK